MTRGELEKYILRVASLMGLKDWDFLLREEPAEGRALAQVETIYGQKYANIWVGVDFWDRDPDTQRHVIVHELVHCHQAVTTHMIAGSFLAEKLGQSAYEVFASAYEQAAEYTTDAIATAIEPNIPLPRSS